MLSYVVILGGAGLIMGEYVSIVFSGWHLVVKQGNGESPLGISTDGGELTEEAQGPFIADCDEPDEEMSLILCLIVIYCCCLDHHSPS